MRIGSDEIIFDVEECLNFTHYKSKDTIYRGIVELIKAEIIARGKNDYKYFINPLVIFNGNRLTFAKTYVRKHKTSEDPNQLSIDFDDK
jgi:intergrase/recombinase